METTVDRAAAAGEPVAQPNGHNGAGNGSANGAVKPNGWASHPEVQKGTRRPRVLIVGAGFGGINAAHELGGKDVDVLVLDRNNYHGFWPLLYQVATAGLEAESIAYPVRAILRKHRNLDFQMANVQRVDFDNKIVYADAANYPYDYMVLAAGSANNYFGNEALEWQTFGLKDIDEAERLRNRLLYNFELAVHEQDRQRRLDLMTFAIIGGGPTGVELTGALSELIRHVLKRDYPMLDVADARVILIEASDKILAAFPESLQKAARKRLDSMGVEVRMNMPVDAVNNGVITFKDGTELKAGATVWAAGVKAAALAEGLAAESAKGGRVKVTKALDLPDHPEVFVIGDMAYLEGYKEGQAYPMVAPVAIQQGKMAAKNILALIEKRKMKAFHYFDKGNLATIGRRSAIMDAFGFRLSGRIAWLGWLFVHIMYLVGFRNRVIVLTNWAFNYFTYDRGVRLITSKDWITSPDGEPVSRGVPRRR
jgi:NADH:ubiquinone reductase (H+-translocating)